MATYPTNDTDFSQWFGGFIAGANGNLPVLSMTAADITALQALKTDLDTKLATETTARNGAIAATAAKNVSRKAANTQASFRAKIILANPNIPVSVKEQLGLTVRSAPTATSPVVPTGLSAYPIASGKNNRLEWDGNNNRQGTQYVIEAKRSVNGAWSFVDFTSKTKYDHLNQTPGRAIAYRVRAKRAGLQSPVSNEAVAYVDAAFPLEDNGITL